MSIERTPIGKGRIGETFKVEDPSGQCWVEKEFRPVRLTRLLYRIFFQREHPYSPENPLSPLALGATVQRRHIASLLSQTSPHQIEVIDAQASGKGLKMPFINGRPVTYHDKQILGELDEMAKFLEEMGVSSWSMRGPYGWLNWLALRFMKHGFNNVLVTSENEAKVVDNEAGTPFPDRNWGGIRRDDIDSTALKNGLKQSEKEIVNKIGNQGFDRLEKACKIEELYWSSFKHWERSQLATAQTVVRALQPAQLAATIDWLLEIGKISPDEAISLRRNLDSYPDIGQQFKTVAPHLIIHNLIGLLPPGLSSLGRFTYTLGAKAIENVTQRRETKHHTWFVAVVSLIPSAGNLAYLVDLIPTQNPDLTRLALESISFHCFYTWLNHSIEILGKRGLSRKSVTIMEKVLKKGAFVKRIFGAMLEEHFGKEIVEGVVGQFVKAAKSEPRISDDFPTLIYHPDGQLFLVDWKRKVLVANQATGEVRKASLKETQQITDLLRQESISVCQDFERILTAI